ncbi:MAG: urease accessory protein UreF [Lachnospiraceae bacterium]
MEKRKIFEEYLEARRGKPVSHCCAYGVFCAAMGIEEEETLYHYLYAQTSAMVTNRVKTIPLSQSAGQKLLSGCYEEFEDILSYICELYGGGSLSVSTRIRYSGNPAREALFQTLYVVNREE